MKLYMVVRNFQMWKDVIYLIFHVKTCFGFSSTFFLLFDFIFVNEKAIHKLMDWFI